MCVILPILNHTQLSLAHSYWKKYLMEHVLLCLGLALLLLTQFHVQFSFHILIKGPLLL